MITAPKSTTEVVTPRSAATAACAPLPSTSTSRSAVPLKVVLLPALLSLVAAHTPRSQPPWRKEEGAGGEGAWGGGRRRRRRRGGDGGGNGDGGAQAPRARAQGSAVLSGNLPPAASRAQLREGTPLAAGQQSSSSVCGRFSSQRTFCAACATAPRPGKLSWLHHHHHRSRRTRRATAGR